MSARKNYFYLALILLTAPLFFAAAKYLTQSRTLNDILPKNIYTVSYEFDLFNLPEEAFIKAYLPSSNNRQTIQHISKLPNTNFVSIDDQWGKRAKWEFVMLCVCVCCLAR